MKKLKQIAVNALQESIKIDYWSDAEIESLIDLKNQLDAATDSNKILLLVIEITKITGVTNNYFNNE